MTFLTSSEVLRVGSYAFMLSALLGLPVVVAAAVIDTGRRIFWVNTLCLLGGYAVLTTAMGIALAWTP